MIRQTQSPASPLSEDAASPEPASSSSTARTARSPRSRRVAGAKDAALSAERQPLLDRAESDERGEEEDEDMPSSSWMRRNQWLVLALASGVCAAFNGVFAKLTTTELTTKFAQGIAGLFNMSSAEGAIEVVVRGAFFALNLIFNGVMWSLFTAALARGNSTTQVSIMNTSTNFVTTALLGFAIFSESLPPLWWVGATLLIAGNVIIGRKDEGDGELHDGEEDGTDGTRAGIDGYRPLAHDLGDADVEVDGPSDEVKDDGDDAPQLGNLDEEPEVR